MSFLSSVANQEFSSANDEVIQAPSPSSGATDFAGKDIEEAFDTAFHMTGVEAYLDYYQ